MGYRLSTLLALTVLLAAPAAAAPELEPARDALRRHQYDRAAELLAPLAGAGNAEARYQLGILYLPRANDVGLPPDVAKACRLLTQAASADHAKAAHALSAQVESGVCKDTGRTANEWTAVALVAGHSGARGATEAAPPGQGTDDPPTLLKRLAREGDVKRLEALLATVKATEVGRDRRTALHEAADGQRPETARLLLGHGADVNARDASGDTPLLVAARRGAAPVIDLLLGANADTAALDARGGTALMLAVAAQSQPSVELLLAKGADVGPRNAQGLSALDLAERAGKTPAAIAIADALKARGASGVARASFKSEIRADDRFAGWTPLMIASDRGDAVAFKAALASGDVNGTDGHGLTALAVAARAGHAPFVEALLAAGAKAEARAEDGDTALGGAVRRKQAEAVRVLVSHGASPNTPQLRGALPLMLAAEIGAADVAGALVAAGAKVNGVNADGETALMVGAQHDEAIVVATLLGAGADARLKDRNGRTALLNAAAAGADRAALALVAAGAIDIADDSGTTPLGLAAQRGDLVLVQRLLKANAAKEVKTKTGNTPLLLAAGAGRIEVVRELLAARANIEARNSLDNTPLLAAVVGRQVATAKLLIEKGANTRIRNGASMSVGDLAKQAGDPALVALFAGK
jgi:ankyrin repeat protein